MRIILLCYFILINLVAVSQEMGDIMVNENNSATIAFDQAISFVVFGNNPPTGPNTFKYYDFFTDGSVCVIRGNTPDAPKTSITIKLANGSVWFGFVSYGENSKILYSFSSLDNPLAVNQNPNSNLNNLPTGNDEFIKSNSDSVNIKTNQVTSIKREIYTIGQKRGDVTISIVALRNDSQHTYISFEILNNSGNAYIIDGILFKFIEGKRRGIRRNEASTEERVMPVTILGNRTVKAYTTEYIGVAIPLFSVDNSGKLEVTIREREGTRNAVLTIKGTTLNQIEIF